MQGVLSNSASGGVSVFSLGNRRWLDHPEWPPPVTLRKLPFSMAADASGASTVELDRRRRMRSPGGRLHHPPLPAPGGFRFADVAGGPSVVLRTDPLDGGAQVAGSARARFSLHCIEGGVLAGWLFLETSPGEYLPFATGGMFIEGGPGPKIVEFQFSETAVLAREGDCLVGVFAASSWPEFYSPPVSTAPLVFSNLAQGELELPVLRE
jgi:hypothetical protein